MPVPYRKTPRAAVMGLAAFLDVIFVEGQRTFYGAILVVDGRGQPQEFVHNTLLAPSGALWTPEKIQSLGIAELTHSLFDACRREPDLLVCLPSLGSPDYLKAEIAPALPFLQVNPPEENLPAGWSWVNTPPTSGMKAAIVAEELERRNALLEPFDRLHEALKMLYPVL